MPAPSRGQNATTTPSDGGQRNVEYLAQVEQRYREEVLYPKLARDARHLRDIDPDSQATGRLRRARRPARRVGRGLLGVSDMLIALRNRLGSRTNGCTTADRE